MGRSTSAPNAKIGAAQRAAEPEPPGFAGAPWTLSGLRGRLGKIARRVARPWAFGSRRRQVESDRSPARPPQPVIFLSFRREDTLGGAHLLFNAVRDRFPDQVFFDYDVKRVDWVGELIETVRRSSLVLILIGPRWIEILAERRTSGQTFSDAVHIELLAALRYEIPLLAVLMDDALLPTSTSLPPELSPLAQIPSVPLRQSYWQRDLDGLVEAIDRNLPG
jgi:hypothetical protein